MATADVRRTPSTKDRLVEAALEVARRDPSALTLDAVADRAGVSKGGLLYHFPDKDSLVAAILDAVLERFAAAFAAAMAADTAPGGRARAYLRVCADPTASLPDLAPTVLAVLAHQPALLDRLRDAFAEYQREVEQDAPSPEAATAVRLAADGLWLADAFGLAPPQGARRAAVLAALEQLP